MNKLSLFTTFAAIAVCCFVLQASAEVAQEGQLAFNGDDAIAEFGNAIDSKPEESFPIIENSNGMAENEDEDADERANRRKKGKKGGKKRRGGKKGKKGGKRRRGGKKGRKGGKRKGGKRKGGKRKGSKRRN